MGVGRMGEAGLCSAEYPVACLLWLVAGVQRLCVHFS